jgi:SAM-dependent methyltransferase
MVYTSYGVIGWLPDLNRWAQVISKCLKPGGTLVFVEFHPAVWMFDNDFTKVTYSYFLSEAIVEKEEGTYADNDADIALESVSWNHSIGEVYNALQQAGLRVDFFQEYNFSPYPFVKDSVPAGERRWHIPGMEGKLPLVYAIRAVKE